jgi:hypothetical protein
VRAVIVEKTLKAHWQVKIIEGKNMYAQLLLTFVGRSCVGCQLLVQLQLARLPALRLSLEQQVYEQQQQEAFEALD